MRRGPAEPASTSPSLKIRPAEPASFCPSHVVRPAEPASSGTLLKIRPVEPASSGPCCEPICLFFKNHSLLDIDPRDPALQKGRITHLWPFALVQNSLLVLSAAI